MNAANGALQGELEDAKGLLSTFSVSPAALHWFFETKYEGEYALVARAGLLDAIYVLRAALPLEGLGFRV